MAGMIAVEILEELGYEVLEAGDGPSALKILAARRDIDLLVTDVDRPEHLPRPAWHAIQLLSTNDALLGGDGVSIDGHRGLARVVGLF